MEKLKTHALFGCKDGLIFTKNLLKQDVLCIPREAFVKGRRLIAIIINHAHSIIGHFGQFKTVQYIRRYFWWTSMVQDIETFCMSCGACAASKDTNSKPRGLLHNLPIPDRPWQSIGMDFLGPLPKSNNFDYLLVIIDQLTSQVHLLPTTTTIATKGIVWIVLKEVVRLHGIPESIVFDRDAQFTSVFHLQTDGATERANRSIAQILQTEVDNCQEPNLTKQVSCKS